MGMFNKFIDRIKRFGEPIEKWYEVSFTSSEIKISASPPGRDAWTQLFFWEDIIRVMFQGEGIDASDGIYIWTTKRPESYVVPTDSKGGEKLIKELISRGYFESEKFQEAVLSPYGVYCWPEDEKET